MKSVSGRECGQAKFAESLSCSWTCTSKNSVHTAGMVRLPLSPGQQTRGEEADHCLADIGHIGLDLITMEVNTEILSEKNR